MRHLFLIIMIALLPLRGWVSDAMATGMAATQAQQTQTVATKILATHAYAASPKGHLDLETMMTAANPTAADCSGHALAAEGHAADTHCESCSICQACHTVGLTPTAAGVSAVFNIGTLPRAAAAQFASASTALGEKPPIF